MIDGIKKAPVPSTEPPAKYGGTIRAGETMKKLRRKQGR